MTMTSHRPHMVRALHEWILDNDCTPYILVNAFAEGVQVPQDYVKEGQIVLNISPMAIQGLNIFNEGVEFSGRFGGIPTPIYVPIDAILGIYAKENGQGMMFDAEPSAPQPPPKKSENKPPEKKSRPSLRVVK